MSTEEQKHPRATPETWRANTSEPQAVGGLFSHYFSSPGPTPTHPEMSGDKLSCMSCLPAVGTSGPHCCLCWGLECPVLTSGSMLSGGTMAAPAAGTLYQELSSAAIQPAMMMLRKPHHLHTRASGSLPRQTLPGLPCMETTGGCPVLQGGNRWYMRTSRQDRGSMSPVSACFSESVLCHQSPGSFVEGQMGMARLTRKPLLSPLEIKKHQSPTHHTPQGG